MQQKLAAVIQELTGDEGRNGSTETAWMGMCREAQTASTAQQTMPWIKATRHLMSTGAGQVRGEAALRLMALRRMGRTAGLRKGMRHITRFLGLQHCIGVKALGGGENLSRMKTCVNRNTMY